MKSFSKNVFGAFVASAMLLLSGCGTTDDTVESRMLVQQYIDKGEYDAAIALLTSRGTFDDSDKMLLASAYMGKSGFSFNEILQVIANSNDSINTSTNSAYVSFLKSTKLKVESNDTILLDMDNALDRLSTLQEPSTQSKLFKGIILAMKATASLSLLSKMESFDTTDEFAKDDIAAAACAMDYVPDNTLSSSICTNVTESPIVVNGKNYTLVTIEVGGSTYNNFYKLADATGSDVLLTKGACSDVDHSDPNCIQVGTAWVPTPVLDGNTTMQDALLDTLNTGLDTAIEAAPSDVQEDILQYKSEIDTSGDGTIDANELSAYLESKL